jgi:predicted small integral membrane protein
MSLDRSFQCPNICRSRRGYCLYRASIIDVVLFMAASNVSICGLTYWDRTQPDATSRSNLLRSRREVIGSLIDIGVVGQRWIR